MSTKIPQCRKCRHFFITYEPRRPYGCRAMKFKSSRNPAIVVYESSGIICQLFTPKEKPETGRSGGSSWQA